MREIEIAQLIAKRLNYNKKSVQKVLKSLSKILEESVEAGESMRFPFGTFNIIVRKPKPAYNFKEKKRMIIPPTIDIEFKPAARIKRILITKNTEQTFDFVDIQHNES